MRGVAINILKVLALSAGVGFAFAALQSAVLASWAFVATIALLGVVFIYTLERQ